MKFFCIPEISGQAEESFMGAERPNENGRLTERCRRCRLKAESGWGGGRMTQAKRICAPKAEYAKKETAGKYRRYV